MRRYTDYKDSGSDWIGQAPKHWEVGRLKDFVLANPTFRIPRDMTADDLVEFVPMTNVDEASGVISRFDLTPLSEVVSGYKRFCNGDVIFAKITPCMENGNCAIVSGLSRNIGFGSTEFLVYRPKQCLNARYLHYFLYNDLFRKNAVPFMKGSAGQKRLPSDYVETHVFPLPPLPEQQAIADYLDAKTAQIDRKIDLLTQKAAKYRQLKQAIINTAVTQGLDKSAPMKDSGVAWLGEVPAHWVLGRIKDFVRVNPTSRLPQTVSDDALVEFVPMANVDEQLGQIRSFEMVPLRNVASGYKRFQNGDVIFARITPCMENGNCAIVRGLTQCTGFGSTEFQVYRPLKGLIPQYLHYFLHNESFRKNAESHMKGSAGQKRVPSEYLETHGFALPPLPEQCAITAYLNERTADLDRVIEVINAQTARLATLRKALINAVVTGKLRVT